MREPRQFRGCESAGNQPDQLQRADVYIDGDFNGDGIYERASRGIEGEWFQLRANVGYVAEELECEPAAEWHFEVELFFLHGAVQVVPQRRTYTIYPFSIFIVMDAVIDP